VSEDREVHGEGACEDGHHVEFFDAGDFVDDGAEDGVVPRDS